VDDTAFDYARIVVLGPRALAMLSAALRHVRDAEHLMAGDPLTRSPDQAFHLAGFGPECARKATLPRSTYDQAIGHGVTHASELALQFALVTDPVARRYDILEWKDRYPELSRWHERARYDQTGTHPDGEARAIVAEAREIVDRLAFALWADGHVPAGFVW
jgi:hypothetical protein